MSFRHDLIIDRMIHKRWINLCFSWEIVFFVNKGRTSQKPEDGSHEQSNERKHESESEPEGRLENESAPEAQPESEIAPEKNPKASPSERVPFWNQIARDMHSGLPSSCCPVVLVSQMYQKTKQGAR
jgi:hypothetical protein